MSIMAGVVSIRLWRARGALQAQRGIRDALGDLDQTGVSGRRIGRAVDAASEREGLPAVAQGVVAPVPDAGLLGLAIGERIAELCSEVWGFEGASSEEVLLTL